MALKNEIGNTYGYLTVISRAENDKNGRARWLCKCKCGNEIIVMGKNLRSGNTKSCGCYKKENPGMRADLTGKRFGKLLVLGEPQNGTRGTIWKCLCDCGTICYKVSADLIHGNVKSCGCYKADLHSTMNDLTGQTFGELTALFSDTVAKDGQRIWHCRCSCGKEIDVRAGALRSGKTKSCGCKTSKGNLTIRLFLEKRKISFKQEYTFSELYNENANNPLRFDFALFKEDNLLCLIEYNGKQHYEPVDFFGGVDAFIDQQKRDNLKIEFCKNKKILLFTIKYDENIQERMEEILDELYG
ncbi:MAG: hypothetical protein IJD46_00865 [Bacilli bacterium]|nr:hypothetical protein [Bacilli bacterium]